jgi:hypothetical protein
MPFNLRKALPFVFLLLALLSLTGAGMFFREYFFYWFFTGTSSGKVTAFFLFAAFVYFIVPDKGRLFSFLPFRKHSLAVFSVCMLVLFLLGFLGISLLYSSLVHPVGLESPNSDTLFVCALSKPENSAFFSFLHNHYLKPALSFVLLPLTSYTGGDSASALLQFTEPWLLVSGLIFLITAFLYFLSFLSTLKSGRLSFFLWVLCGYGLMLSSLDGGILSMAGQVNIALFAVMLADRFIKDDSLLFSACSLAAVFFVVAVISALSSSVTGIVPYFSLFVFPAPLLAAFALASQKKARIPFHKFVFSALVLLMFLYFVIVLAPYVPSGPPYDSVLNENILSGAVLIFSGPEDTGSFSLQDAQRLSPNAYYLVFAGNTSLRDLCLSAESAGASPLIIPDVEEGR